MAPARDPSGFMLWIGAPCFHCKREDFLPLRCMACERLFCAEHFRQEAHACPHPARDVLVPLCPLCEEPPRGWRRDMPAQELSSLLESHWTAPSLDRGGCRALLSQASDLSQRCCVSRCQAAMHLPVKCPHCAQTVCLHHRAPSRHACTGAHPKRAPKPAVSSSSKPQATSDTQIPAVAAPAPRPTSSRFAIARRAAQERASTIRAMQERHARGMLSDPEKMRLAQLMAQAAEDRRAAPSGAPACTLM
ncbi:Hypothetical protein MSYG_0423 [Malassezia sympodialis ATCC 42132]|uniref:AN1-type domain-containing protein n=1 Tax=Malassezia sympodialis (strain ATCC 42132) TaxID=1230383 RepID=A0A1M8A0V5_MALS4|nr:Hypothetical protein MSYG_0423 [Malassezia sympodialis ATCC 42132]